MNTEGKIIINPQFEIASPFSDGLALIKKDNKFGFIDKTGKIVITPQFELAYPFSEGKAAFFNGKQWGYIDTNGSYVINPQFDSAYPFSEGKAVFFSTKNYGYINEKGTIEINPQFDETTNFKEGLALSKQGKSYGYIGEKGNFEINPQFDMGYDFNDGIAFVNTAGKWGVINKKGKYIINPQFEKIKEVNFYDVVKTDYYDATSFIEKFFTRQNNTSFDGFNANSTLQSIIDNSTYGNYANCPGNGYVSNYESGADTFNYVDNSSVICSNKQYITNDITLKNVTFHFNNRICYRDFGVKSYKMNEKIMAISYYFTLSGAASNKGASIVEQMKSYIEKANNMKFTHKETVWGVGFDIASNNSLSFALLSLDNLSNDTIELYIAFDKESIENRLTYTYSGD
ncbi:WG repeat-containing protein [Capnocytophaga leadbetteri]|uniref:WG repeat-containing protein n=1 Tax=Capnocytophaga leadbetteri TaxID=327575 RepID=UPI00350E5756